MSGLIHPSCLSVLLTPQPMPRQAVLDSNKKLLEVLESRSMKETILLDKSMMLREAETLMMRQLMQALIMRRARQRLVTSFK